MSSPEENHMSESSDYAKRRFHGEVLNATGEAAILATRLRAVRSMLDVPSDLAHIQTIDLLMDFNQQLADLQGEISATSAAFAAKLKTEPAQK